MFLNSKKNYLAILKVTSCSIILFSLVYVGIKGKDHTLNTALQYHRILNNAFENEIPIIGITEKEPGKAFQVARYINIKDCDALKADIKTMNIKGISGSKKSVTLIMEMYPENYQQ